MNIKIFTTHHQVPQSYVSTELFVPCITGMPSRVPTIFLTDDVGDNIANRHSYCEMRIQYYIWKNSLRDLDYLGFDHYRRSFLYYFLMEPNCQSDLAIACASKLKHSNDILPNIPHPLYLAYLQWLREWPRSSILFFKEWVSHFDIIVPRSFHLGSMKQQYAACHNSHDWDLLIDILTDHARFSDIKIHLDFDLPHLVPCNMYIMRSSLFVEYISFWFDIMERLRPTIEISDNPYQSRVYAFLSERLFTIYLHHLQIQKPNLRIGELPFLFTGATTI